MKCRANDFQEVGKEKIKKKKNEKLASVCAQYDFLDYIVIPGATFGSTGKFIWYIRTQIDTLTYYVINN